MTRHILLIAALLAGVAQPLAAGPFEVWDGDTFSVFPPPRSRRAPAREDGDGDTFSVFPPPPRFGTQERVRIRPLGYDTAERREPCEAGRAMDRLATAALRDILAGAREVRIEETGRMSWDRSLARVVVDGEDLAEIMIGRGLARAYRRGLPGWCE